MSRLLLYGYYTDYPYNRIMTTMQQFSVKCYETIDNSYFLCIITYYL